MTHFTFGRLVTAFSVPWSRFVGAFLYYVVLTLIAIGVDQVSDGFMVVAYGLPVAVYALVLLSRVIHALASAAAHIMPLPRAPHAGVGA